MLIYITNRKLPKLPSDKPSSLQVSKIGQTLANANAAKGNAIVSGIASKNYKSIKFYPKGSEANLFNSIDAVELKKPWLVFLHGFHQDPAETIEKAKKLHEIYGVNVVLFSWPSRPKPIKSFSAESLNGLIKSLGKSLLFGSTKISISKYFFEETRKAIADLKDNYKPAKENARKSTNDFYAALELLNNNLVPKIGKSKISLVVHSLGNFLMQQTINDKKSLPINFFNIVFHQADVKSSNHASWVSSLNSSISNKLYITINVFDYVLTASNILNKYNGEKNTERLGQSVKLKPEGIHQGYIQGPVSYLDFTDADGINSKHEILTENNKEIDPVISDLLGRLFRSEKRDKLPEKRGTLKGGFIMMPTIPKVFKPQYIREDESLCDNNYDEDCLISPLQYFEDPFKLEAEYDLRQEEDE